MLALQEGPEWFSVRKQIHFILAFLLGKFLTKLPKGVNKFELENKFVIFYMQPHDYTV